MKTTRFKSFVHARLLVAAWPIGQLRLRRAAKTISQLARLLVLTGFIAAALAQEVTIPDAVLKGAIRQALGKATGDITVQEMETLTVLNAGNVGIRSLEGLGAARNLTALNLGGLSLGSGARCNQLRDFSFLAGLTRLAVLAGMLLPALSRAKAKLAGSSA